MIQANTQRRRRSSQQSISPQFLLRVGGLPIDVVDALHFEQTVERIEQLLSLEKILAERKDALVDAMFEEVNAHKGHQALRRKLINLKRDIFNQKMLDGLAEKRELALLLSAPARELLLAWLDIWKRYQELLADAPLLFTQELEQKRALLKATINTPGFRQGIALASPALDSAVDAYLVAANDHLNRNARTVERSLMEYLLRTACKTSPFSTFTSVAAGSFAPLAGATAPDISYQAGEMLPRSFTTFNVAVLYKLSNVLLNSATLRTDFFVRLTPGWQMQDEYIRYVRRISQDNGKEDGLMALSTVHEDVFYLPLGRMLEALQALLDHGQKMRLSEISAALCALPEYTQAREEIDTYLDRLLQLGLLVVPDLQLDLQSGRVLSSYCQQLRALEIAEVDSLADSLQEIETLVDAYASAPHTQRPALMREVKRRVVDCFAALGEPEITLPRTLIYEDTILPQSQFVANELSWQKILSHMGELQQILPVFDLNLEKKIVTQGYFRARYGAGQRCDDFLAFVDDFRQNFFEQYLQGSKGSFGQSAHTNYFQQPELERLHSVRQVITDYLCRATAQQQSQGSELVLDDNFIQAILPYVPENKLDMASNAFLVQFAREGGDPLAIVNHIYAGFTQNFSRFVYFFCNEEGSQVLPLLKATLQRISPPGVVFAELKGGYDATNLNIHPPVTAYELVCPGERCTRPLEEQIPLEDLTILDDGGEGHLHLYSKRLGKEVIPLYLGFLLPMLLPETQQILLSFSYTSMCMLDLWKGINEQAADEKLVAYPRLRYKNLVLQRAQWRLPATLFPQREPGQDDFTFFLHLNRWRREQGLPRRIFIAPKQAFGSPKAQDQPAEEGNVAGQQMRNYKPLYLDFENFFSMTLLEALVRDSTHTLVLTEMLPNQGQLWLKQQGHSYVSEFMLEIHTIKEETDA